MIKEGTYEATLTSHGTSETKAGKPQAFAAFKINSTDETITWYGSFSEKAAQYTIKNLLTLGLQGNNPAGPLEVGKVVSLVIEHETGEDMKIRPKVKFINELGGARNVIPKDQALAKLSDLTGAVMAARAKLGVDDSEKLPW